MRIVGISSTMASQSLYKPSQHNNHTFQVKYDTFECSNPTFKAVPKVKSSSAIFEQKRSKLLKHIETLLEEMPPDLNNEEFIMSMFKKAADYARSVINRQMQLLEEMDTIFTCNYLSDKQKYDTISRLKKEYKRLDKGKLPEQYLLKPPNPKSEKHDYCLLNKFKSAILNEDYNLSQIFNLHYSDLAKIKSVEELKEKYPKISIPPNPIIVIAEKLAATVTRDFYEEFDILFNEKNEDALVDFSMDYIQILCAKNSKNFKNPNSMMMAVAEPTFQILANKYAKMKKDGSFSSIPEFRKNKLAQFSQDDIRLFSVDYDDYILSVIKQLYLEGKKPNEIIYNDGINTIQLHSLRDSNYKFEKVSEKIKSIINEAQALFKAQRDYDNFSVEQFKERLNFYASRDIGDNDAIFDSIVKFDGSRFHQDDIDCLKSFLRELDATHDGKQSVETALKNIRQKELYPKGTEKLNRLEQERAEQILKEKKQKALQLRRLKDEFDDAMNILYKNNMTTTAAQISKYRPESLDVKVITKSKYIVDTIKKHIDSENVVFNKSKLETAFLRWDTYNFYRASDKKSQIFVDALDYAKKSDGNIDIDKAGQYLINREVIENYPESLKYFRKPQILKEIMEHCVGNKAFALNYLIKYDSYLTDIDKTKIIEILKLFNIKDKIDKILLKEIVDDYINYDTVDWVNFYKSSTNIKQKVVIATKAKREIKENHTFPSCIKYFQWFEEALTTGASYSGYSGIKQIGRNDESLVYKIELKLAGMTNRLLSSKNDYVFDTYSEKGLH